MKKYKLGTTLGLSLVLPFLNVVACSSSSSQNQNLTSWWDDDITIQVNPGYAWKDDKDAFIKAAKLLENKINELKNSNEYYKNLPDVKVKFDWSVSKNETILQNIITKKHDLGFASITATMNAKQSQIQPLIQTLTNSFTFDQEWKTYKTAGESNHDADLKKIASDQTTAFKSLYNNKNSTWNGSIYKDFYNLAKKVDFYRGVIWVFGPNANKAKQAWENKDWTSFRDVGIMHRGPKSGGGYQLQEKLLKKHFGKNAFKTLAEEMQNHPDKFKKAASSTMKNDGKYGIAFDNEGSFAWTKRKDEGTIYFNVANAEILIVTEPLKYDIGSFRINMDPRQARIIAIAFKKLVEAAEAKSNPEERTKSLAEIYGPSYGYNDYRLINDRKAELDDTWKSVMGS